MTKNKNSQPISKDKTLIKEIKQLIKETRSTVAKTVNSALTILYWKIGKRLNEEILTGERADYGKEIIKMLSYELTGDFGKSFSHSALTRMNRFYLLYPDIQIVATLSQQLSWSHFIELIPIENQLQRGFYAEMCRLEGWSVRILRKKINSMLFERTAIFKKPEEIIKSELQNLREQDQINPNMIFKEPYVLDFLNLKDTYNEKDLETAILAEMEKTFLELGPCFALF